MKTKDNSVQQDAFKMALRSYLGQIRRDARYSIPCLTLTGVGNILVFYAPPLVIAAILGRYANGGHLSGSAILPYLLAFAGVWLAGEVVWRIAIFFLNRAVTLGINDLYRQAMADVVKRDISFFHDNFAGSLTKSVVGYAQKYEIFIDNLAFSVTAELIPLAFVVIILWRYSPWLVLALLGMMGLTLAIVWPLIKRRQKMVVKREAASNLVAGHVADTISNMDAVQSFAREHDELKTHNSLVDTYSKLMLRSWDYQNNRIDIITSPLFVGTNVLGLYLALRFSGGSSHNLQAIFVTFSYFSQFTRIVWEFNRIYRNIESSLSEAAQFTKLLLSAPAHASSDTGNQLTVTQGRVDINKVRYAYDDTSQPLFDNFDLRIAAGEHIALVGHSGGGKTSITKLLLRFIDPQAGHILIDDQDIGSLSLQSLRQQISYVPQEPIMFHRSLLENIRYGKPTASLTEINQVSDWAHATEFINQLPEGLATTVGERGVKLSGGQRQRIAIARAMLKDAPIIVLDEATSALDSHSEVLIQDALWKLMANKTAIVIAHRLSTIQKMDRIIVLNNGVIAEQGTHKELLDRHGVYASLWAHQSGGFIED